LAFNQLSRESAFKRAAASGFITSPIVFTAEFTPFAAVNHRFAIFVTDSTGSFLKFIAITAINGKTFLTPNDTRPVWFSEHGQPALGAPSRPNGKVQPGQPMAHTLRFQPDNIKNERFNFT
jgi:hypothetical protein